MNGINMFVNLRIFETGQEAADAGFTYVDTNYRGLDIQTVVLVKEGTISGNSTVDFVLKDSSGNNYVFLITAELLKTIVNAAK